MGGCMLGVQREAKGEGGKERERISLRIPPNSNFTLDLMIITFEVWTVLSPSHFPPGGRLDASILQLTFPIWRSLSDHL